MAARFIAALGFAAVAFIGCTENKSPAPRAVAGEYVYHYKSGEVEAWTLSENMGYRQDFYRDDNSYKKRLPPLYSNGNTWYFKGREIIVNHPMFICKYPRVDQMAERPWWGASMNAAWKPPGFFSEPIIVVSESFNYWLTRVKK